MRKNQKGELATVLAIGAVIVFTSIALVSQTFLKKRQTLKPKAAEGGTASLSCIIDANGRKYVFFQRFGAIPVCSKDQIKEKAKNLQSGDSIDAWQVEDKRCTPDNDNAACGGGPGNWCYYFDNKSSNSKCLHRDPSCDNGSCFRETTENSSSQNQTGSEESSSSSTGSCSGVNIARGPCTSVVAVGTCVYRGESWEDRNWFNQWVYCCADGNWYAKSTAAQGDPNQGWQTKDDCENANKPPTPTPKPTLGTRGRVTPIELESPTPTSKPTTSSGQPTNTPIPTSTSPQPPTLTPTLTPSLPQPIDQCHRVNCYPPDEAVVIWTKCSNPFDVSKCGTWLFYENEGYCRQSNNEMTDPENYCSLKERKATFNVTINIQSINYDQNNPAFTVSVNYGRNYTLFGLGNYLGEVVVKEDDSSKLLGEIRKSSKIIINGKAMITRKKGDSFIGFFCYNDLTYGRLCPQSRMVGFPSGKDPKVDITIDVVKPDQIAALRSRPLLIAPGGF